MLRLPDRDDTRIFGVLLDTLVVRSLLVPSVCYLVGPRTWWPSRLASGGQHADHATG